MTVLRGGRLPTGEAVDLVVVNGVVTERRPAEPRAPGPGEIDLREHLLLAALAEPHLHLDKALSWDRLSPAHGNLDAAVATWGMASATLTEADVRARAMAAIELLVGHGVTAVRTHVNACAGQHPLLALGAIVGLRDELRDDVDLQVSFLTSAATPDPVVRAGIGLGIDLLGGAPHTAADPEAETLRLLRFAAEAGLGVDLHVDEQLDPAVASLRYLAEQALSFGLAGRVTASHCVSLGVQPAAVRAPVIEALRAAAVTVVACPMTNLYLQGRGMETSPPRGLTAVRDLLDAGIPLAAGTDNLRDPFNPMGRGDPLEVASLLVTAGHLTVDEALTAVGSGAHTVLGLSAAGPEVGRRADLLAIRAESVASAVAAAPVDRIVIRAGRVVARSVTRRELAFAAVSATGNRLEIRRI